MRSSLLQAMVWLVIAAAGAGCQQASLSWFAADAAPAKRAPTGQITHSDQLALGEAVAGIFKTENPNRYTEASAKLAALYPRFDAAGATTEAAETMFWSAYCHEHEGRKDTAANFYDKIVHDYPQTRAAEQAKLRLSRLEFKRPAE